MDRRKAMKIFAGVVVGSGAGMYALSKALKPDYQQIEVPERLPYIKTGSNGWEYDQLDPSKTAELAYKLYPEGSCMYAVFKGVLSQLADKFGEPYASFPFHMMR